MGSEGTLERIKQAEIEADGIVFAAREKAKAIVEAAKKQAVSAVESVEFNALKQREFSLAKAKADIAAKQNLLVQENVKKTGELRQKALQKLEIESDFLLKKFLEKAV